jgi:hypothetical protein
MSERQDIDSILRNWSFQPGVISARLVETEDGREVMQMRIEMGVLQMETTGRPDGQRPHDAETYLDYLNSQLVHQGDLFALTDEDRTEIDREFLQFYHRRICCLVIREFRRALADADHTLALMDLVAAWAADPEWTLSHEQYRPFVLFHRSQAAALAELAESGAESAMEEIDHGLEQIRQSYVKLEAEEQFEQNELVNQLMQLKESLRNEYSVGQTLTEQLNEAVAAEQYERAARLRDEIAKRHARHEHT